jgi:class 3 adenylate cyclase
LGVVRLGEGAILIFDIRGFTALSDRLAPNEVMALLADIRRG